MTKAWSGNTVSDICVDEIRSCMDWHFYEWHQPILDPEMPE